MKARKLYRQTLDAWLHRLSHASGPLSNVLIKFFERFAPRVGARIRFRQGSFSQALAISQRSSDEMFRKRLEGMISTLHAPLPEQAPRNFETAFNQQVLHCVHSSITFDTNGYAVRTEQIVRALRDQGISVNIMTRLGYPWDLPQHTGRPLTQTSKSLDIEYTHSHDAQRTIGSVESDYLRNYAETICKKALESNSSVIHAHSNYLNGLAAAIAGRKLDIPVVYEMRGLWHETRALTNPKYRDTEHFQYCEARELHAAASADTVVAISEPLSEWLTARGINSNKIHVVSNAGTLSCALESLSKVPTRIGYVGSIVSYEGLDCLVYAMQRVIKASPEVKATIVGDGPYLGELRRLIRKERLENVIELVGRVPVDSVNKQYQRFAAAVVPRNSNNVTELIPPLKPMEILSLGVPLIVSDVAPLASIVTHKYNGLLFNSGSADQLAECILEMVNSASLRDQLGRQGRKWAQEHNWEGNAKRYIALYQELFK